MVRTQSGTRSLPPDGRVRAVVEGVSPSVDMGRFAAKRVLATPS